MRRGRGSWQHEQPQLGQDGGPFFADCFAHQLGDFLAMSGVYWTGNHLMGDKPVMGDAKPEAAAQAASAEMAAVKAVWGRLAAGAAQAVVKCGRSPQVEREARKALDDVAAEAKLDELAKSSGWDVVVCAVEWLLRSLTGAAQADGELLAMSSDTRATKEYLQPQVDRARAWLALRKGAKR